MLAAIQDMGNKFLHSGKGTENTIENRCLGGEKPLEWGLHSVFCNVEQGELFSVGGVTCFPWPDPRV